MAREARRACGYRKVGGLYLCASGDGLPCCKMPIILHVCPTCNGGIKQTRGWQWIDPKPWIAGACKQGIYGPLSGCPLATGEGLGDKVGLIWVGEAFYKTPGAFSAEANAMGISRRIQAIPRGFKLGESWVFLAHPKVKQLVDAETGEATWLGGVFRVFKPERIEKIVTQSQSEDADEMAKLAEAGITPVVVADDDRDHQGSVYDDAETTD